MELNGRMIIKNILKFEVIVPAIFMLFVCCQIMSSPMIGMADNGDFARIMGEVGLCKQPALSYHYAYLNFVNRYFLFGKLLDPGYYSSQVFLVAAAILINKLAYSNVVFDVTFLGYLYVLLFGLGIFLICRGLRKNNIAPWLRYLAVALMMIMFTDVSYTAYFNSLFGEPASYVFLFLTVGLALNLSVDHPNRLCLWAFFGASLLLLSAKVQNITIGIALLVLSTGMLYLYKDNSAKKIIRFGAVLIVLSAIGVYAAEPVVIRNVNLYDSIFDGILVHDTSPRTGMIQLGVNPKYSVLTGTAAYSHKVDINSQQFDKDFFSKISTMDIIKLYCLHPGQLLAELQVTARNAAINRPGYLGNYERPAGLPPRSLSNRWSFWNIIRERLLPKSLWFYAGYFGLYFFTVVYAITRNKDRQARFLLALCGTLGLMAVLQFFAVLGEGENELIKHLFLFDVLFDMTLLIAIAWLANKMIAFVSVHPYPGRSQ
jgi:hypothetical protein